MNAPELSDSITVMRARRARLAKLIAADGSIVPYDQAYRYDAEAKPVTGLIDLLDLMTELVSQPSKCVVRGELIAGAINIRRLIHPDQETGDDPTLRDVPRRWLALDLDGVERPESVPAYDLLGCADVALERLPKQFRRTSCVVQASASHGIKPGCRLRLWFWCDRPMSGLELKRWLPQTDTSVFCAAQPIYTAAPVFSPGRVDHLPQRIVLYPGEDWLRCPTAAELAPPPNQPAPGSSDIHVNGAAVRRAIQSSLDKLRNAADGERHPTLCKAAYTLGGFIGSDFSEPEAERLLLDAVKAAGGSAVVESIAKKTIKDCLKAGGNKPLEKAA